jgi:hypothetical protein
LNKNKIVYDHLVAKLKEEKEPMKDYFEDLLKKMRLMNQKLLEEAKERKYLKKIQGELNKDISQLKEEKEVKSDRFSVKWTKTQRMLGMLQKISKSINKSQ